MKLVPYPKAVKQYEKTLRHYFSMKERWWALSEQPRAAWTSARSQLPQPLLDARGWHRVERGSQHEEVVQEGHGYWHATSERACDEARDRHQVFPGSEPNRAMYVGRGGITVVIAAEGDERHMVTAFRVVVGSRDLNDPLDFEACERKAVRKYGRYSSYLPNGENS